MYSVGVNGLRRSSGVTCQVFLVLLLTPLIAVLPFVKVRRSAASDVPEVKPVNFTSPVYIAASAPQSDGRTPLTESSWLPKTDNHRTFSPGLRCAAVARRKKPSRIGKPALTYRSRTEAFSTL